MLRRTVAAVALVVAVLAAAWAYQSAMGTEKAPAAELVTSAERSAAAPSGMTAEGKSSVERVVSAIRGRAERQRPGGEWLPLTAGTRLSARDRVRTIGSSTATIELGTAVTITVAESTEVSMGTLTDTLSKVRLDDGRVASIVRGSTDFKFRVEVRGSDMNAETRGGAFSVMSRTPGRVAVATSRGTVAVTANGERVDVAEGKASVVEPGAPPSEPFNIPGSLFLHVGPPPSHQRAKTAQIQGKTVPGAVVETTGGNRTVAGHDGKFSQTVSLKYGDNHIVVEVTDVLGRHTRAKLPRIVVDATLERDPTGEVEW